MKLNKVFELTFKICEGKKSQQEYITCKNNPLKTIQKFAL